MERTFSATATIVLRRENTINRDRPLAARPVEAPWRVETGSREPRCFLGYSAYARSAVLHSDCLV
jgi:hypothetical protein